MMSPLQEQCMRGHEHSNVHLQHQEAAQWIVQIYVSLSCVGTTYIFHEQNFDTVLSYFDFIPVAQFELGDITRSEAHHYTSFRGPIVVHLLVVINFC